MSAESNKRIKENEPYHKKALLHIIETEQDGPLLLRNYMILQFGVLHMPWHHGWEHI